jgi:hypothetical protein
VLNWTPKEKEPRGKEKRDFVVYLLRPDGSLVHVDAISFFFYLPYGAFQYHLNPDLDVSPGGVHDCTRPADFCCPALIPANALGDGILIVRLPTLWAFMGRVARFLTGPGEHTAQVL